MRPTARIDVAAVIVVSVVAGLLSLSVMLMVQTHAPHGLPAPQTVDMRLRERAERTRLQAAQHAVLSTYRVLDAGTGSVAIPIERATELVVAERPEVPQPKPPRPPRPQ
ncbi:MAG TPA: hypothetical protein PKK06_14715 [Phycisphaerae bacterium]|nr:hypothetical protein [Phycisphaerae bacterium]HNU46531.1 hypothetical protein [Phycisphaerae bacterium]